MVYLFIWFFFFNFTFEIALSFLLFTKKKYTYCVLPFWSTFICLFSVELEEQEVGDHISVTSHIHDLPWDYYNWQLLYGAIALVICSRLPFWRNRLRLLRQLKFLRELWLQQKSKMFCCPKTSLWERETQQRVPSYGWYRQCELCSSLVALEEHSCHRGRLCWAIWKVCSLVLLLEMLPRAHGLTALHGACAIWPTLGICFLGIKVQIYHQVVFWGSPGQSLLLCRGPWVLGMASDLPRLFRFLWTVKLSLSFSRYVIKLET